MLGAIVTFIKSYGLNAYDIAFIRLFFAAIILGTIMLVSSPSSFKLNRKAIFTCILIGVVSQGLFNVFYFTSIVRVGITMGVILLYTAPAFTLIFSKIFLDSHLRKIDILAISTTFIGSILTVSGGTFVGMNFDILGIVAGLLAGASYGLLPILNKSTTSTNKLSILFYSFLVGALVISPLANVSEVVSTMIKHKSVMFMGAVLGFFPTIVSHFTFLEASKTIEAFKMSVIANLEVVVATTIAFIFYAETLNSINVIGIILVLVGASIPSLNLRTILKKVGLV